METPSAISTISFLQSFPMVLEWGTSWALGISPSNPRSTERTSITTQTTTRWPFLSSYLVINLFSEQSLPACSLQPNGAVSIQAMMARLHFSSGSLHIRRLHLVLHRDRSDRRQATYLNFQFFLRVLLDWGQNEIGACKPTFCAGAALLLILANICLGCKYK